MSLSASTTPEKRRKLLTYLAALAIVLLIVLGVFAKNG